MRALVLSSVIVVLVLSGPLAIIDNVSGARGPVFAFKMTTDRENCEASVSDPTVPSATVIVTIENTGPSVLSVRLSTSINLGGSATVSPAKTGYILYGNTASAIVTLTLPEATFTSLVATLRIDAVCEQNTDVTDFGQLPVTVKQWHRVKIENFTISPRSPVEKEIVQFGAMVRNTGNGPSFFSVSTAVDGKPLRAKVDGSLVDENSTVRLEPGRFFLFAAQYDARYGHHNFFLQVTDVTANETGNLSGMVRDSKVISFSIGINFRDWIPYFIALAAGGVGAGVLAYRYRARLRAWRRKRLASRAKMDGKAVPAGSTGKDTPIMPVGKPGTVTVGKKEFFAGQNLKGAALGLSGKTITGEEE